MSTLLQQIILSILGGLVGAIIGAVVGGYLSYKGAVDAAKKQIDYLYSQERENRLYQETQQKKVMKLALLAETKENLTLVQNHLLLSSEAWDTYKGNISKLSETLQAKLLEAYIEIKLYNSYLEWDWKVGKLVVATLSTFTIKQIDKVQYACKLVIEELSKD